MFWQLRIGKNDEYLHTHHANTQNGPPGFSKSNNQNRGPNVQNQYQAPINQYLTQGVNFNQGYQAPNYQAPIGPSSELARYIKQNEANVTAMQNQINTLKNDFQNSMIKQGNELKNEIRATKNKIEQSQSNIENMFASLMNNMTQMQASTSGTLPGNTIPNPKGELKATTRSGLAFDGPSIPITSPVREVIREPEVTKDKVHSSSPQSTAHVQPTIVQIPII